MGRWAQRRISGGGPPATPTIVQMISAAFDGLTLVVVTYDGPVTASDFEATDFETHIGGLQPEAVNQMSATELQLDFGVVVTTEAELEYSGDVPNVLTPQTIEIT